MKAKTKKELNEIMKQLQNLKEQVELIRDDAQEEYDNHSETWQESEKGEKLYEDIDYLESAMSDIETAIDSISEVTGTTLE